MVQYSNEWQRRLALLQLAFRQETFTREDVRTLYTFGKDQTEALIEALKNDRYALRDTFDILIRPVRGKPATYHIKSIGERFRTVFLPVGLVTMLAIAQMSQNERLFPPDILRELLNGVRQRLGVEDKTLDDALASALTLATWRDDDAIPTETQHRLRQAIQERHIIQFDYLPSRPDDDLVRSHIAEPYELFIQEGHLYLRAFPRQTTSVYGTFTHDTQFEYRVGGIIPDSIQLLDEHFLGERQQKLYSVHYILSRKLTKRGGSTSFDEIKRHLLPDGRLEIVAQTPKPFDAMRKLLSYGAQCEVLGGDEVLRLYRAEVEQMRALYNIPNG